MNAYQTALPAVLVLLLGLALVAKLAGRRLGGLFHVVRRWPVAAVRAPVPGIARFLPSICHDHSSREVCKLCFEVNAIGFSVPDRVWLQVVPEHVRTRVVCLRCFVRLADEKLVPWDREIELFPVSLASHIGAVEHLSSGQKEACCAAE